MTYSSAVTLAQVKLDVREVGEPILDDGRVEDQASDEGCHYVDG